MQVQAVSGNVRLEDDRAVSPQDPESEVPGEPPGAVRPGLPWGSVTPLSPGPLSRALHVPFRPQTQHSRGKLVEALST